MTKKLAEWKNDNAVKEWFTKIGNKRTIKNYSNEFPKFLFLLSYCCFINVKASATACETLANSFFVYLFSSSVSRVVLNCFASFSRFSILWVRRICPSARLSK